MLSGLGGVWFCADSEGEGTQLLLWMLLRTRGHGPHSSCRVTGFPEEPSRSPTSSSILSLTTGRQLLVEPLCTCAPLLKYSNVL